MSKFISRLFLSVLLSMMIVPSTMSGAAPKEKEALAVMRKATEFMVDTVSCHGGYLWNYAEDLSDQWGEPPARPSQIWVQSGTPDVGEMFLGAYEATGDGYYLRCAEKAANALIYGQHPLGGWNYLIDFDITGLEQWYRDVFSQFKWGMEEYRHYYGNCTYDDDTTQGTTRFLLRLYMTTFNPAYREPLLKALNFMLISQYPNGAWPQRYPLRYEFVHDGLADYTSYYTMNDNAMRDIIDVLIEAYEKLGNEEYLKAALRGADFMIVARGPESQAGWAEQYDMEMNPAWARTHEPAGYMPRQSIQCIKQLEKFYLMTGDRRYLKPIPGAIKWLKDSSFGIEEDGRYKMARYYEQGTNLPIYQHKTDMVNEQGYGLYLYDQDGSTVSGGWVYTMVDIESMKREYERISALSPREAMAEYKAKKNAKPGVPKVDPQDVEKLIKSLDERGAWVEDVRVYDVNITMIEETPRKIIKGISTHSFIRNMNTLMNYLKNIR